MQNQTNVSLRELNNNIARLGGLDYDTARALLQQFRARSTADLKPEDYAQVLALVRQELAKLGALAPQPPSPEWGATGLYRCSS